MPTLAEEVVAWFRQASDDPPSLEAVAAYLSKTFGHPRKTPFGESESYYFELQKVSFTISTKEGPSASYDIKGVGLALGPPRWRGAGVSIHAVMALPDGKVYLMVPPTEEKSSYLGKGTTTIRNFDRLALTGITEEAYTALFKKVMMAANKAAKLALQYQREGGGGVDLSVYAAQARAFRDKWTRGETWGAVKKVVPVQKGYQIPQGKVDVGVVFNLNQFQKYVESGKAPSFLDDNMFKVVTRTEAGVVTPGKGFDAVQQYGHRLAFIGELGDAVREFNNKVIAPWRQALGEPDYRR